jgi:hypothetical protein
MNDSPWFDRRLERRGQGAGVAFRFSRSAMDWRILPPLVVGLGTARKLRFAGSVGGAERGILARNRI